MLSLYLGEGTASHGVCNNSKPMIELLGLVEHSLILVASLSTLVLIVCNSLQFGLLARAGPC